MRILLRDQLRIPGLLCTIGHFAKLCDTFSIGQRAEDLKAFTSAKLLAHNECAVTLSETQCCRPFIGKVPHVETTTNTRKQSSK
jgi:hypothetical protein